MILSNLVPHKFPENAGFSGNYDDPPKGFDLLVPTHSGLLPGLPYGMGDPL